jgi:hypothetical protein
MFCDEYFEVEIGLSRRNIAIFEKIIKTLGMPSSLQLCGWKVLAGCLQGLTHE